MKESNATTQAGSASEQHSRLMLTVSQQIERLKGKDVTFDLCDVYKAADTEEARSQLEFWLSWARRCRIPEFVELSRKVHRRKYAIVRAVELCISNARKESMNNEIKLTIRMGYGFWDIDNLIAPSMLRCPDLQPQLPGRMAA